MSNSSYITDMAPVSLPGERGTGGKIKFQLVGINCRIIKCYSAMSAQAMSISVELGDSGNYWKRRIKDQI